MGACDAFVNVGARSPIALIARVTRAIEPVLPIGALCLCVAIMKRRCALVDIGAPNPIAVETAVACALERTDGIHT